MTKQKYWVKLTPLKPYFFGGERNFGSGKERNYLVKSRDLPQQTSLVGLIRYQLLAQNGLLSESWKGKSLDPAIREKATQLIGPRSFHLPSAGKARQLVELGVIQSLSPLYLCKTEGQSETVFTTGALNADQTLAFDEGAAAKSWRGGLVKAAPLLQEFDVKKGLSSNWYSETGEMQAWDDTLFQPHEQVGIHKDYSGKTKDDAFFKQTFNRLATGFSFGFMLELDAAKAYNFAGERNIWFGGERSLFALQVRTENLPQLPSELPVNALPKDRLSKIVLLCDSLVDEAVLETCSLVVGEKGPFQFLTSQVAETEKYYQVSDARKPRGTLIKSEKYMILKRGSVLYSDQFELIRSFLDQPALQQIGMNLYQFIQAKS